MILATQAFGWINPPDHSSNDEQRSDTTGTPGKSFEPTPPVLFQPSPLPLLSSIGIWMIRCLVGSAVDGVALRRDAVFYRVQAVGTHVGMV